MPRLGGRRQRWSAASCRSSSYQAGACSSSGAASTTSTSTESRRSVQQPFDYFHINSIDVAPDGDLLVSARNTWAVYKIARKDGRVVWRLGGKRSDFRLGPGATFAWQHDARLHEGGRLVSIFDNAVGPGRPQSRAIVLALDERACARRSSARHARRPALTRVPRQRPAAADGDYFVGWGTEPYFTEYAADGRVRYDATAAARRRELPRVPLPVERPARRGRRPSSRATASCTRAGTARRRRRRGSCGREAQAPRCRRSRRLRSGGSRPC